MPKAAAAPAWLGAPPATGDGFAFVNGEFFAESSGQNRHRRATQAELKTHFTSGNDKDHPAHWFEAQLIHYGLQPSKTKSVARMRLFDAVNAGTLAVPARINKLEGALKKEWTKQDRETKKGLKDASVAETKKTTAGVKRKAETPAAATAAPKKAKTAAAALKPKPAPKAASATPAKKQTARCNRGGISQGSGRGASTIFPSSAPAPATATAPTRARRGTTARCSSRGRPTRVTSIRLPSPAPAPAPVFRTKQTARRSSAFMARGRIPYSDNYGGPDDEPPPPPYSEEDEDTDTYGEDVGLAPLGLLNGSYDISCPYVTSEWPFLGSDFDITLTPAGTCLWGGFDLGIIQGVMHFDERPWESSHDSLSFTWRGREHEGPMFYGHGNTGWVKFLGDGRIDGYFDFMGITFRGRRLPGQGTKSDIDARTLRN